MAWPLSSVHHYRWHNDHGWDHDYRWDHDHRFNLRRRHRQFALGRSYWRHRPHELKQGKGWSANQPFSLIAQPSAAQVRIQAVFNPNTFSAKVIHSSPGKNADLFALLDSLFDSRTW